MSRERGLALVSVLWGVAILSLIAAAMLSVSLNSAHIERNLWNAARGGAIADAAVNRAVLSLLDSRAGRWPRVDATPSTLSFDGVAVRLWVQDETGKINLNFANRELLQGLFLSAGMSSEAARGLADRILARRIARDARQGVSSIAFRDIDELLTVPGVSAALLARIAPALTVYGHGDTINEDVAPREALLALPGMDEKSVAALIRERDDVLIAADAPPATGVGPGATFLVTAETRVDGARIVRTAVVQFTGDETRPYLFLSWR